MGLDNKTMNDLKKQAQDVLIKNGIDGSYRMSLKDLVIHLQNLNVDLKDAQIQELITKIKAVSK